MKKNFCLVLSIVVISVFASACSNEIPRTHPIEEKVIGNEDNELAKEVSELENEESIENKNISKVTKKVEYKETEQKDFQYIQSEDFVSQENEICNFDQFIDGYLCYHISQGYNGPEKYYLFNPTNMKTYDIPSEVVSLLEFYGANSLTNITGNTALVVKYFEKFYEEEEFSERKVIVAEWNFETNKVIQREYNLDPYIDKKSMGEYVNSIYYDGHIFLALTINQGIIVKINDDSGSIKVYNIQNNIELARIVYPFAIYNNELYVTSDIGNISKYDKEKDEFIKLDPSPEHVTEEYMYFTKNRNELKVYNGNYSAEFKLPYIEEDDSITGENSYIVTDVYKNSYIITKRSDDLHLYVDGKRIDISIINELFPNARFIDGNRILYNDEGNLYLFNISNSEKTLIQKNFSIGGRWIETESNIYFNNSGNVLKYNKPNIDETNYKKEITEGKTVGQKSLIFEGPLLIDNVPILSMTYDEVLNHFGEPKEIRIDKFSPPSIPDYDYFAVLCYEGIDISLYPEHDSSETIKPTQDVWRFDLTSDKYNIGELRVGMSAEEYLKKFGQRKMYLMADIKSSNYDEIDLHNCASSKRIIIMPKPENYYSEYDYVYYEDGIAEKSPVGLALLIKDNKIDRIVYRFTNAS